MKLRKRVSCVPVVVKLIAYILLTLILIYGLASASDAGAHSPLYSASDSITRGKNGYCNTYSFVIGAEVSRSQW